jgi:polyisoprenoid-binding protein YceI
MRQLACLGFAVCLLLTSPIHAEPTAFFVPPQQSSATLQVSELGFANVTGIFSQSVANFKYDEADKSLTGLRFAITTASLSTGNPYYANELLSERYFAARQFSEITFLQLKPVSFTDGKAKIEGELAVRGERKPLTLEATLNRVGKSPYGGSMWGSDGYAVGLSLRGTFKRADYGMNNPYDETASRFGDEINLQLDIQGIKN